MSYAFADQAYVRACMMCGFAARRNEWDETPPLTHCPACGIELERLACGSCNAPLALQQSAGVFMFGPQRASVAPFCGYCGEPTAPPHEPQHRTKPQPPAAHFSVTWECELCKAARVAAEKKDEADEDDDE